MTSIVGTKSHMLYYFSNFMIFNRSALHPTLNLQMDYSYSYAQFCTKTFKFIKMVNYLL